MYWHTDTKKHSCVNNDEKLSIIIIYSINNPFDLILKRIGFTFTVLSSVFSKMISHHIAGEKVMVLFSRKLKFKHL